MAEQWWTDEDWVAVADAVAAAARAGMARTDAALAALAPTVERIRREAKAEALQEAATYVRKRTTAPNADIGRNGRYFERQSIYKALRAQAARIEAGDE